MSEMRLEGRGLGRSYRTGKKDLWVLRGVDVSVAPSETLAIVGPSGAGKSTLLHLLGGLDRPSEGQVCWQGQDLAELADGRRARLRNQQVGFVFQFYHLIGELTCEENVMLPGRLAGGIPTHQLRREARNLLKELGLQDRMGHLPRELSGGEQQRCAIARALIRKPSLLLADEPTGNLDRATSKGIVELLQKVQSERNLGIVMVTHDEGLAGWCARRISLVDGQLQKL